MAGSLRIIIIKLNGRERPQEAHEEQVHRPGSHALSLPRPFLSLIQAPLQVREDQNSLYPDTLRKTKALTVILGKEHSPEQNAEDQRSPHLKEDQQQ